MIPDSVFIGKKIKVYNNHDVNNFNESGYWKGIDYFEWPNEDIKKKSMENYKNWKYPNMGDTGTIIWAFKKSKYIERYYVANYIVKIKDNYVVIDGKELTMPEKQSYIERYKKQSLLEEKHSLRVALSGGLFFQKNKMGDINLLVGYEEEGYSGAVLFGPRIGFEYNIERITAVKVGVALDAVPFFVLRLSGVGYMQDGNVDYRLLPEIGLSLFYFNIAYGYNIHLGGERLDSYTKHRLSLTLNIPLFKIKWNKIGDAWGYGD